MVCGRVRARRAVNSQTQRTQSERLGADLAHRARSTLVYVAQMKIDMARHAVVRGEPLAALRWLWDARRIVRTKRWWFTATMILLFPGKMVRSYMDRSRRNPLQPSSDPASAPAGSA